MRKNYKIIILICILIAALFLLSSCFGNRGIGLDTKQTFRYAYVNIGGEWKYVKATQWRDFDNSDMAQVSIDGNTIYTHGSNIVYLENEWRDP